MNDLTNPLSYSAAKIRLLNYLIQDLLTPLTSVMGMGSVLSKEIYGTLTPKQREYVDIINDSSTKLRSIVHEMLSLTELYDPTPGQFNVVNIEGLFQQVINDIKHLTLGRQQQIKLSLINQNFLGSNQGIQENIRTPLYWLNKEKIQHILHHLLLAILQTADVNCTINIDVKQEENSLNMRLYVLHPWLGNDLPFSSVPRFLDRLTSKLDSPKLSELIQFHGEEKQLELSFNNLAILIAQASQLKEQTDSYNDQELLRLLLTCQLLESQGGKLLLQGSNQSGFYYLLKLPCQQVK